MLGLPNSIGYYCIAAGSVLVALVTLTATMRVLKLGWARAPLIQYRGDAAMTLVMVGAFIVLMILGVPVGYGLILAAAAAVLWNGFLPLSIVAQQIFDQTQSFPMLALPFFMLAGTLMLGGNLGRDLLELASAAMLRWRGGPLSTTVVSSVVFGGVSGSAVANASALGSVLIPWQKRLGYPAPLCAANNATSAVIDVLIPPSIPMILLSLVSGVSVADLFVAGLLPGVLDGCRFRRRVLVDFA